MHNSPRKRALVLAFAALFLAYTESGGALISTSTNNSGDWDDPNNWNGGVVPDSTFTTEYQATVGHDVNLVNFPSISLSRLTIEQGASLTIELDTFFALNVADGRFLAGLQNENIINDGTLQINLGGVDANVESGIFAPPHYLNRNGAIIHLNAADAHPTAPGFPGFASFAFEGPFHNQSGATIRLSDQPIPEGFNGGNILFGQPTFLGTHARLTNDGLITGAGELRTILEVTNSLTGTISTNTNNPLIFSGGSHINHGTMQATGPGGFILNALLESSGIMEVINSRLELSSFAQLTTTGGATIDFSGTSFLILHGNQSAFDINNMGNLTVINNSPVPEITGNATNQIDAMLTVQDSLTLVGTMTNHGGFTLAANQVVTTDDFDNDSNVVLDTLSTAVINAGHQYDQTGGTIVLNDATIDASAVGSSIRVSAGSIDGTGSLNGPVNVSGTGTHGTVSGDLNVVGNVNNAGTVSPGQSLGIISIEGDYTQEATGTLQIEISGTDNSDPLNMQYDVLAIEGAATLDGTLEVSLINNFVPDYDDSFTIITSDSLTGDFATFTGLLVDADMTLVPTTGSYALVAALPGDGDLNGIVNFADFVLLANEFGNTNTDWGQGNFNFDNITNFADFVILANHFGDQVPADQVAPEPGALGLLCMGILILRCRRSPQLAG